MNSFGLPIGFQTRAVLWPVARLTTLPMAARLTTAGFCIATVGAGKLVAASASGLYTATAPVLDNAIDKVAAISIAAALSLAIAAVLATASASLAAECAAIGAAPNTADVVIAVIDDQPIYQAEAQRLLQQVLGGQPVDPAVLPVIKAQVLAEIVDRRLVLAYAREAGQLPPAAEIAAAMDELEKKLQAQGSSLRQYLAAQGIDEQDLRRQITWRITWSRLLRSYVTQQRMEQYFAAHRRELDGTELEVSHILISTQHHPAAGGAAEVKKICQDLAALLKLAAEIRQQILAGKMSFQEAARRYSRSPTGAQGGRLGYIGRDGPMVESFTRAAFALQPGEISQPVVTPFGVHLIRCDSVRPGKKELADVLQQVEDGLARQLLEELAAHQRQRCRVQYTGAWPHFKPGTTELAPP